MRSTLLKAIELSNATIRYSTFKICVYSNTLDRKQSRGVECTITNEERRVCCRWTTSVMWNQQKNAPARNSWFVSINSLPVKICHSPYWTFYLFSNFCIYHSSEWDNSFHRTVNNNFKEISNCEREVPETTIMKFLLKQVDYILTVLLCLYSLKNNKTSSVLFEWNAEFWVYSITKLRITKRWFWSGRECRIFITIKYSVCYQINCG